MHWLIGAPPYHHHSAGIRAVYQLCHLLRQIGEDAYVTSPFGSVTLDTPYMAEGGEDTIAVYPETVTGNPWGARRVVRFVCNDPGLLGGDRLYSPDELVVYYHEAFRPAAEAAAGRSLEGCRVWVATVEPGLYSPRGRGEQATVRLVYRGKAVGDEAPWPDTAPDRAGAGGDLPLIELTRSWPSGREDCARLVRAASDLYCYDPCTALADEAVACGALVWRVVDGAWVRDLRAPLDVVGTWLSEEPAIVLAGLARSWFEGGEMERTLARESARLLAARSWFDLGRYCEAMGNDCDAASAYREHLRGEAGPWTGEAAIRYLRLMLAVMVPQTVETVERVVETAVRHAPGRLEPWQMAAEWYAERGAWALALASAHVAATMAVGSNGPGVRQDERRRAVMLCQEAEGRLSGRAAVDGGTGGLDATGNASLNGSPWGAAPVVDECAKDVSP